MKIKFSLAIIFQILGCAAGLTPFLYSFPEGTSIRDFIGSTLILGISTVAFFSIALPALFRAFDKEEENRIKYFLLFLIAGSVIFTSISVWGVAFDIKGYEMSD